MRFLIYIAILLTLGGCVQGGKSFEHIAPGQWRATLMVGIPLDAIPTDTDTKKNKDFSDMPLTEQGKELPFNFIVGDKGEGMYIEIKNGKESIITKDIKFLDRKRDSIIIDFEHYDSYIQAAYSSDGMVGEWVVSTKKNYRIPFTAKHNLMYRFSSLRKTPLFDVSGRWGVTFYNNDGSKDMDAVGVFKQMGNKLEGTFLTTTGDYRFLAGEVQGNKMYLSAFDGSHAFVFQATLTPDGKLKNGGFWAGKNHSQTWEANRNEQAQLPDPNTITKVKTGRESLNFSFLNPTDGKFYSLNDPKFNGKAKIIQIMGTWCPNCADEGAFLAEYNKTKPQNLEIIGLAFEKHRTPEKAKHAIDLYKKRLNIDYTILLAGERAVADSLFPVLDKINGYPTTLFVDKNNQIRKVHTGFSGPATGADFEHWKQEFSNNVKALTAQ